MMAVLVTSAQKHQLEKVWETDAIVAIPESVLPEQNILYVSLINGGAWMQMELAVLESCR